SSLNQIPSVCIVVLLTQVTSSCSGDAIESDAGQSPVLVNSTGRPVFEASMKDRSPEGLRGVVVRKCREQLPMRVGLGEQDLGLLFDGGHGVGTGDPAQWRPALADQ